MLTLDSGQIIKVYIKCKWYKIKILDEDFNRVGHVNFNCHKFTFLREKKDGKKDSLRRNHFKKDKMFFIDYVQNPKVKKQIFDEGCTDRNGALLQN